jgi:hypothetical protein
MKSGGLYPKKPWPIFTMGCFGEAAAPSLTMVLQIYIRNRCRLNLEIPSMGVIAGSMLRGGVTCDICPATSIIHSEEYN